MVLMQRVRYRVASGVKDWPLLSVPVAPVEKKWWDDTARLAGLSTSELVRRVLDGVGKPYAEALLRAAGGQRAEVAA